MCFSFFEYCYVMIFFIGLFRKILIISTKDFVLCVYKHVNYLLIKYFAYATKANINKMCSINPLSQSRPEWQVRQALYRLIFQ